MTTKTSYPKGSYVFEIHYADFPACVRILQIPTDKTFQEFAYAIIDAFFGGKAEHMWEFPISCQPYDNSKGAISLPYEDYCGYDRKETDARKYPLYQYFEKENKLLFVYDFGDDWFFTIKCIRFLPIKDTKQPKTLKSRRATSRIMKARNVETKASDIDEAVVLYKSLANTVEDIGGIFGYYRMLVEIYMLADNLDEIPKWYQMYQDNDSDDEAIEKLYNIVTNKLQKSGEEIIAKRNSLDGSAEPMCNIDRDVIDWDYYDNIVIDACKKNKELMDWFLTTYMEPIAISEHLAEYLDKSRSKMRTGTILIFKD